MAVNKKTNIAVQVVVKHNKEYCTQQYNEITQFNLFRAMTLQVAL